MDPDGAARIADRLARVRDRIAATAQSVGRDPAEVDLLLAVKTQTPEAVIAAIDAGARLLGHNRAQELVAMGPALAGAPHEMHFIGHLQSNKIHQVLPWVACVQSVDTPLLATRLDRAAGRTGRTLDVFVQVNTSGEPTKSGVTPEHALDLAYAVGALPHLRLRGLMTIGANSPDTDEVRASFERLAQIRTAVLASGAPGTVAAAELSMGMSGDLEQAIAAGSTLVRVGSAVFGPRP